MTFWNTCQQDDERTGPTLELKVGQLLMIGFRGFELADSSHIIRDISEYNLGGVILFDYDVPTS